MHELANYEAFCEGGGATTIPQVAPEAVAELLRTATETVLLDVREKHERLADSLPDSEHLPLAELLENGVPFPTSARIVVYCASGSRSQFAAETLRQRGYGDVHNLAGGLAEWRRLFPPDSVDADGL
jgi:rhodanese-related sulfurtransferase